MRNSALRFHEFGKPTEVLREEELPCGPPGPGQVLLRILGSPINPSDLGSIAGSYGALPALPAVPGREGVGEVLETGPETGGLVEGQRVLLPEGSGCWRTRMVVEAADVIPVPDRVAVQQAAMASINPLTAWLLLETVPLQPGDWVLQNAANSAVGHHLIQLCRHRGFRTINLVRHSRWIDPLKQAGADLVLLDGPDAAAQIRAATRDRPARLGCNSVGGASAIGLIKGLGEGGTLVTFGGMTGEPVRFPTRYLIFNDIRLTGFWLHRWKKTHSAPRKAALQAKIFDLISQGILQAPVEATYPLSAFREAIERASAPGREGKILFEP